jgi:hypothetical protein
MPNELENLNCYYMKSTVIKIIYSIVIMISILSFCSCSNTLSESEAEEIICEKLKLPHDDIVSFSNPAISIWTPGGYWENDGRPPTISFLEEITKSEIYSSNSGFSTNNEASVYFAKGNFDLYKKYKEMGLIEAQSFRKGRKALLDGNGNPADFTTSFHQYGGCYWECVFSLTQKAKDLGINNWQYKAADWVFDEITGIFNDEASKSAEVEYTIKTANPTTTVKLLGEWKETKKNLKAKFKLYNDGWRIEE